MGQNTHKEVEEEEIGPLDGWSQVTEPSLPCTSSLTTTASCSTSSSSFAPFLPSSSLSSSSSSLASFTSPSSSYFTSSLSSPSYTFPFSSSSSSPLSSSSFTSPFSSSSTSTCSASSNSSNAPAFSSVDFYPDFPFPPPASSQSAEEGEKKEPKSFVNEKKNSNLAQQQEKSAKGEEANQNKKAVKKEDNTKPEKEVNEKKREYVDVSSNDDDNDDDGEEGYSDEQGEVMNHEFFLGEEDNMEYFHEKRCRGITLQNERCRMHLGLKDVAKARHKLQDKLRPLETGDYCGYHTRQDPKNVVHSGHPIVRNHDGALNDANNICVANGGCFSSSQVDGRSSSNIAVVADNRASNSSNFQADLIKVFEFMKPIAAYFANVTAPSSSLPIAPPLQFHTYPMQHQPPPSHMPAHPTYSMLPHVTASQSQVCSTPVSSPPWFLCPTFGLVSPDVNNSCSSSRGSSSNKGLKGAENGSNENRTGEHSNCSISSSGGTNWDSVIRSAFMGASTNNDSSSSSSSNDRICNGIIGSSACVSETNVGSKYRDNSRLSSSRSRSRSRHRHTRKRSRSHHHEKHHKNKKSKKNKSSRRKRSRNRSDSRNRTLEDDHNRSNENVTAMLCSLFNNEEFVNNLAARIVASSIFQQAISNLRSPGLVSDACSSPIPKDFPALSLLSDSCSQLVFSNSGTCASSSCPTTSITSFSTLSTPECKHPNISVGVSQTTSTVFSNPVSVASALSSISAPDPSTSTSSLQQDLSSGLVTPSNSLSEISLSFCSSPSVSRKLFTSPVASILPSVNVDTPTPNYNRTSNFTSFSQPNITRSQPQTKDTLPLVTRSTSLNSLQSSSQMSSSSHALNPSQEFSQSQPSSSQQSMSQSQTSSSQLPMSQRAQSSTRNPRCKGKNGDTPCKITRQQSLNMRQNNSEFCSTHQDQAYHTSG